MLKSEKKIRLRNIFCNYADIANEFKESSAADIEIASIFEHNLTQEYLSSCNIDKSAQIYACGYAAHSISTKVSCEMCRQLLRKSKGAETDDIYFDHLQRGGLSVPTDAICEIFFHMSAVLQDIIQDTNSKKRFFEETKNKNVLIILTFNSLDSFDFFTNFETKCDCGAIIRELFLKVASPLCNILLNNFTKLFNDEKSKLIGDRKNAKGPSQRKIKSFSQ